jgi:hypothetical protein
VNGACSTHAKAINAYNILVSEPEGKHELGDLGIDGGVILMDFKQGERV